MDVIDQNFSSTQKIVIEQDEIQKSRVTDVPALLSTQANISVTATAAQPSSIFVRGGDSSHVLILVDGVPIYDASTPQKTANLLNLNVSKIKRVTILKGSQSVIYGGQALAGVISIETFADDNRPQTSVLVETAFARDQGSQQITSVDGLYPLSESISLSIGLHGLKAQNNSPGQDSDQLYPRTSGGAELGVKVVGDYENIIKLGYSKDKGEINDSDFATSKAVDIEDYNVEVSSSTVMWILKKENVFSLSSSLQKTDRSLKQPLVADLNYTGNLGNIRLDADLYRNSLVNLIGGMQLSSEEMEFKNQGVVGLAASDQYEGVFLKSTFQLPMFWQFEYGLRHEASKLKSLATLHHVGLNWNKVLLFEYSTGFKAPSLFQKYDVTFGDPDLKPEKSQSFSVSVDHQFGNQVSTSLTYFDTQFENLIDYSFAVSKYQNIFATRTVGAESITKFSFLQNGLRLSLGIGYQEPRDVTQGHWLARRSLYSGSFKIAGDLNSSFDAGSELIYIGEKSDKSGTTMVKVDDYTLLNVFGNLKFSDQTTAFVRIENLSGIEYQTTYGYYNKGATYKLGAQILF